MTLADLIEHFGNAARPYGIYALGTAMAVGPFVHADFALMGITATGFAALIGARSTENVFATQADKAVKTTTIQATGAGGGTVASTTTVGVASQPKKENET